MDPSINTLYSCGPGANCTTAAIALGSAFAVLGRHAAGWAPR